KAIYSEGEGEDLYSFDVASRTPTLIAHQAMGVLGASEDASRVYFASREAIAGAGENSEEDEAQPGQPNVYLYEAGSGAYAFVATISSADATIGTEVHPTPVNVEPYNHMARVSADGGTLAFISTARPTGYDNSDSSSGEADTEVYRYEAPGPS